MGMRRGVVLAAWGALLSGCALVREKVDALGLDRFDTERIVETATGTALGIFGFLGLLIAGGMALYLVLVAIAVVLGIGFWLGRQ